MEQLIIKIFADQFGRDPATITADMCVINDFTADSLDIVEIVMALESTFNIELEEDEYRNAESIAKITSLVQSKLKS